MKTQTQKYSHRGTGTIHQLLIGLLSGILLAPLGTAVSAKDNFQHNALFNPTSGQLKAEDRGRVMIYDGLENEVVERAMDEQFARVEHMMFVRIRHTQPNGVVNVEDDGCD
jgi:hypothetical protein